MVSAIGNVYFHDSETEPYRLALQLHILITHKLVQDHALKFDAIESYGTSVYVTLGQSF